MDIGNSDLVVSYECDSNGCDFGDALEKIRNSARLESLGVRSATSAAVSSIATRGRKGKLSSDNIDGYVFHTEEYRPYLYLRNASIFRSGEYDAWIRIGVLDFGELRRKFIHMFQFK